MRRRSSDTYEGIDGFRRLARTYWSVWTVRDGKGVKLSLYVERGRALAAAGRV